jgi:hypothetical protein
MNTKPKWQLSELSVASCWLLKRGNSTGAALLCRCLKDKPGQVFETEKILLRSTLKLACASKLTVTETENSRPAGIELAAMLQKALHAASRVSVQSHQICAFDLYSATTVRKLRGGVLLPECLNVVHRKQDEEDGKEKLRGL